MATTPLITLQTAKERLRVTSTHQDDDITRMTAEATATVVDYLKRSNHGWTPDTVPDVVKAAILRQLEANFCGDFEDFKAENDGLAPGVKGLLMRQRDPAIA